MYHTLYSYTAPIESHSLEPCTLPMTDPEPKPATETVDPSVNESMAEEVEDGGGSPVQQDSSDEKLSDSEQQQQEQQQHPAMLSMEETPGKRPTHIERSTSLDLTKPKVPVHEATLTRNRSIFLYMYIHVHSWLRRL